MVAIPMKPLLSARQLLEMALSRFCAFGLQFTSDTEIFTVYFSPVALA
jgi:hypothetical protein